MSAAEPALNVVYTSPRGKRCMLVPHSAARPWLYLRYLDDVTLSGDGFFLSRQNFRLLREASRQGDRVAAAR